MVARNLGRPARGASAPGFHGAIDKSECFTKVFKATLTGEGRRPPGEPESKEERTLR